MKKSILLFLLLLSSIALSSTHVNLVEALDTIYIRSDGSVDPPTAPIQRDVNVYTFTDNIYDEIIVETSNIIIDGAVTPLMGRDF